MHDLIFESLLSIRGRDVCLDCCSRVARLECTGEHEPKTMVLKEKPLSQGTKSPRNEVGRRGLGKSAKLMSRTKLF